MFNMTDHTLNRNMLHRTSYSPSCQRGSVKMTLEGADLWRSFHQVGTEMIIGKHGRRMFPHCSIKLSGLQPHANYIIMVEMAPLDDYRYRYRRGCWEIAGKADPKPPCRTYRHPDSPATGKQLMAQPLSFQTLKLTNTYFEQNNHLVVHSMHRYFPKFLVIPADSLHNIRGSCLGIFSFPETVFTAVTQYQNPVIIAMKIAHNPCARQFRGSGNKAQNISNSYETNPGEEPEQSAKRCCCTCGKTCTDLQMMPLPSQLVTAEQVFTEQSHPSAWLVDQQYQSTNFHLTTSQLYDYSYGQQLVPEYTAPNTYSYGEYIDYQYSNAGPAETFDPLTPLLVDGTMQYGYSHTMASLAYTSSDDLFNVEMPLE